MDIFTVSRGHTVTDWKVWENGVVGMSDDAGPIFYTGKRWLKRVHQAGHTYKALRRHQPGAGPPGHHGHLQSTLRSQKFPPASHPPTATTAATAAATATASAALVVCLADYLPAKKPHGAHRTGTLPSFPGKCRVRLLREKMKQTRVTVHLSNWICDFFMPSCR